MAKNVSCKITMNKMALKKLERAQITALEKTAEFVHTDVVQAQTIPFDVSTESEKKAGKVIAGTLQNEKHYVDLAQSKSGQGMDENKWVGDGTLKAINVLLKKWGYKENGIAGENFIKRLKAEIINKVK